MLQNESLIMCVLFGVTTYRSVGNRINFTLIHTQIHTQAINVVNSIETIYVSFIVIEDISPNRNKKHEPSVYISWVARKMYRCDSQTLSMFQLGRVLANQSTLIR